MSHTLQVTTPSDVEIEMTRIFDAPRQLVYACWTQPPLVKRWLTGPDGWSFVVCDIDLRVGGKYRYVWRNQEGAEMGMGGSYRDIAEPERLVCTELFDEDWTGGEALTTLTLEEADGQTTCRQRVKYASKSARDSALQSGMEHGVAASYDRLEKVLTTLV